MVLKLQTQLLIGSLTGRYKKYHNSHKTLAGSSVLRNGLKETGFIENVRHQDSRGLGSTLGTVKKNQETQVFDICSLNFQQALLKLTLQAPKSPRCP